MHQDPPYLLFVQLAHYPEIFAVLNRVLIFVRRSLDDPHTSVSTEHAGIMESTLFTYLSDLYFKAELLTSIVGGAALTPVPKAELTDRSKIIICRLRKNARMVRAFVSVDITDDETLHGIASVQEMLGLPRPVPASRMHFTLLFLGNLDAVSDASRALRRVRFSPFDVLLHGLGAFPSIASARTVWIGTDTAGARALAGLASDVADALGPLGLAGSAKFTPHVTIFRIKNRVMDIRERLERVKEHDFGSMHVCQFRLKQSVLGPTGPTYSDLEVYRSV